ncbi:MAG: hypothetical protein QNL04_09890 [SAR324 cluster bacterium]|nr:hypothetical protein [SAR324 cluster bacterium]
MHLLTTFIALLMVGDAVFTLTNFARVENMIHQIFPDLDLKKVAFVEGAAGLGIIVLKMITDSFV